MLFLTVKVTVSSSQIFQSCWPFVCYCLPVSVLETTDFVEQLGLPSLREKNKKNSQSGSIFLEIRLSTACGKGILSKFPVADSFSIFFSRFCCALWCVEKIEHYRERLIGVTLHKVLKWRWKTLLYMVTIMITTYCAMLTAMRQKTARSKARTFMMIV